MQQKPLWFLKSIRNRITLAVLILTISLMALFTYVFVDDLRSESRDKAYSELVTTGTLLQGTLNRMLRHGGHKYVNQVLSELSVNPHFSNISITDKKCKLLFTPHSYDLGRCLGDILIGGSTSTIEKVARSGVSEYVFLDQYEKFIVYVPLIAPKGNLLDKERYVLVIEYVLLDQGIQAFLDHSNELFGLILIMLFVSLMLWLYLHNRLTQPLKHLSNAVEMMSNGDVVENIPFKTADEIGLLARALESMSIERSLNERKLQRLSMAVEQGWDSIIVTNLDAKIEFVNAAFTRNTGYLAEEVVGRNPRILQSGETPQETYDEMWQTLMRGDVWKGELINQRKNGDKFIEYATISPVRDKNGEIFSFIGIKQDITELKQLEKQRTEAERAVNSFFNQRMSLNMIATMDGRIQRVNPAWERVLGYSVDEMEGKPFINFVHPDDRENTATEHQNVILGESTYEFENRYRDKEGNYHTFIWTSTISKEDNIIYAVANDITERKKVEDKLRDIAEVFHSSGEGVMLTDENCLIKDVNNAFINITGYSKEEVIGKNPKILSSGHHDRAFYQSMWEVLKKSGHWSGEIWNRRCNGEVYPELLTISSVLDELGSLKGFVGVFSDITNIKESERKIRFLAHHDPLTELPNRLLLDARLGHSINHASRNKRKLAVMFIDVDRFKYINDSMGHSVGDELLRELASRLIGLVRSEDTVSRIGGDEFVIILEDVSGAESLVNITNKIMSEISSPFELSGNEIRITASVGIAFYPDDGADSSQLMKNADAAMYRAKDAGRNMYQFYTEDLTNIAFEHMFIENALRGAIEREELRLFFQPQIDLHNNEYVGMEVLLRWFHPDQGLISPARFIPIAEQTGIIRQIGYWVLFNACKQGREWLDRGIDFGRISVNVAGPQLQHHDCVARLIDVLEQTRFPAELLEIEVTEGFVMRNAEEAIEKLNVFRKMGIKIAIDDFGTGYSSLSYLKRLPIDKLKIDQSFVRDILEDENDLAIVQSVIALGKAMQMNVIAEGVESEEQAELLNSKGCDQAQGYLYGHPVPPEKLWFNI
ncbi:EAL domain-containing protein [Thiomicrorhabdus sediminis]|uniref:cyclic-guanylate-specific phosphodiesterase n=1 Tax=Thiomicrorhabdus sediminis TaxID=2580412 RepID=A0A4P9K6T9_9GAMM|nr:EAL domain-containing protein [Thiomicrorhabdus sediminis]QCU89957.1 EAL domain-containing protein [Thiomicrorhabdus sediminis]